MQSTFTDDSCPPRRPQSYSPMLVVAETKGEHVLRDDEGLVHLWQTYPAGGEGGRDYISQI